MDGGALGHGNIEAAKNDGCRPFEQAHGGPRHLHEDEHGRRDRHCQGFGTPQRKRLGHEFADGDVEVRDEAEPQRDGRREATWA